MAPVNEPKNTAEAANATVDLPPAPAVTPQSGGVQESGWRDAIAPAIHDLIEAERAARAGEHPSPKQGVHKPGAEPAGPTTTPSKGR